LNQVRPVFKAKKRVFIDKPFAASYADAREIVRLSREAGVPFFSSSSHRFVADVQAIKKSDKHGGITALSPSGRKPGAASPRSFLVRHPCHRGALHADGAGLRDGDARQDLKAAIPSSANGKTGASAQCAA
jgi:hypothetical protein